MGLNVPNSNYASGVANLTGVTGDTVTVACDAGYSGAGIYTCGSDGAFTGAACTAHVLPAGSQQAARTASCCCAMARCSALG